MEDKIIFRSYDKKDRQALEDIIRKTWNYDKFSSPKTAARLARVYLNSCLANQTFTRVAVVNGQPVGIIMGKHIGKYKRSPILDIKLLISIASLYITKEGRSVSKIFGCVSSIDEELLKSCRKNYQGEVAFFAINSQYRGKGIGKKLFHSLLSYMRSEHIQQFFLFTDTSCNYQFYEHQGMTRGCQKEHSFQIADQKCKMTFFLYEYSI
ncbi:GNAT family N-acetyltransferase [Murimonas intestini]|uniref:GNAT family N-acetyltransferase n=1 Tax=Murimonas intestini TaxID=1337051 RepID=UPI0011DCB0FE|nr:GNAT family N-acetyltransferase [Murimonas intestini]